MEIKQVLIISPYFPPGNAADMHRIRMSLPYFKQLGWQAEIVTVHPDYYDISTDTLLNLSIPENTIVHKVPAFPKRLTARFGLGSIALRSIWFYRKKVNRLLMQKKYDLIYFSTAQFPVCVLGAYWKKRFQIPYIIDMQDPWHSDYYQNKPKNQRPAKHWFSYRLNKFLEPIAMKQVSGLVSVSTGYIHLLKNRYSYLEQVPAAVIPFAFSEIDLKIAKANKTTDEHSSAVAGMITVAYAGRGGLDMHRAIRPVFEALARGLEAEPELFRKFQFRFSGTSYAPAGTGLATVMPLAAEYGVESHVTETTDRLGLYDSLNILLTADILFIPGSDDPMYTASKIFPYLMSQKPIMAILHEDSSAVKILQTCSPGAKIFTFPTGENNLALQILRQLRNWATEPIAPVILNQQEFEEHSAYSMTLKQVELFNRILEE